MGHNQSIPRQTPQQTTYRNINKNQKKPEQKPNKKENINPIKTSTEDKKTETNTELFRSKEHEVTIVNVTDHEIPIDKSKALKEETKQCSSVDSTSSTASCSTLSSSLGNKSNHLEKKIEELTLNKDNSSEDKSIKKELTTTPITPKHKKTTSIPPLSRIGEKDIIIVDSNDPILQNHKEKEEGQSFNTNSTNSTNLLSISSNSLESEASILKKDNPPKDIPVKKETQHSSPNLDEDFKKTLKSPLKFKDTKSPTKETLAFNLNNNVLNSYYDRLIERATHEHSRKREFNETYIKYRQLVAEWMIDVCNYFKLDSITTHLAINNLDKIQPHSKFSRFEWQFLAIANILIASKYNENEEYTPPLENLEEITQQKINNETVLQYELFVLKNIGWKIDDVIPISLLSVQKEKMLNHTEEKEHKKIDELFKLAFSFNEKIMLNYQFCKFEVTQVAALSLFLAVKNCSYTTEWNSYFEDLTQTSTKEIETFIQTHQELVDTLTHTVEEEKTKEKTEEKTEEK